MQRKRSIEQVKTTSATLSANLANATGASSATAGYTFGGDQGGRTAAISKLLFSTETESVPSATIVTAVYDPLSCASNGGL